MRRGPGRDEERGRLMNRPRTCGAVFARGRYRLGRRWSWAGTSGFRLQRAERWFGGPRHPVETGPCRTRRRDISGLGGVRSSIARCWAIHGKAWGRRYTLVAGRRMGRGKGSIWEKVVERRLKQNRPSKRILLHAGLISFIEIASKQELFASHGRRQHCSPINPRSVVSPSSKPVLHGDRFNEPGPVGRADCLFGAPERRPGRTTTQRFASGENQ